MTDLVLAGVIVGSFLGYIIGLLVTVWSIEFLEEERLFTFDGLVSLPAGTGLFLGIVIILCWPIVWFIVAVSLIVCLGLLLPHFPHLFLTHLVKGESRMACRWSDCNKCCCRNPTHCSLGDTPTMGFIQI